MHMMTYIISWELEKDKGIFKLAKMREMKCKDLDLVRFIRSDNNINKRWKEYFNKLLNEDSIRGLGTREDALLVGHSFYHRIPAV